MDILDRTQNNGYSTAPSLTYRLDETSIGEFSSAEERSAKAVKIWEGQRVCNLVPMQDLAKIVFTQTNLDSQDVEYKITLQEFYQIRPSEEPHQICPEVYQALIIQHTNPLYTERFNNFLSKIAPEFNPANSLTIKINITNFTERGKIHSLWKTIERSFPTMLPAILERLKSETECTAKPKPRITLRS